MRESFGGAFMLKVAIVFIVIYVSFMAITINYAKAFRVKNQIINIVEQNQFTGAHDQAVINKIDSFLKKVPYNFGGESSIENKCREIAAQDNSGTGEYIFTENGACIIGYGAMGKFGDSSRYYKVVTFIDIELSFFNIRMTIPISGETKVIYINY